MNRTISASSISGTNVKNLKGDNLGEIKDLVINTKDGRIAYAVLSFGGFLGIGDKYFAIPFDAFTYDMNDGKYMLNVDEQTLRKAPGFDKDNWPSFATSDYLTKVNDHYRLERQMA